MGEAEEERKRVGDADVMVSVFDVEGNSEKARLKNLEEKTMVLHTEVGEEEDRRDPQSLMKRNFYYYPVYKLLLD
jgi:hypothetical protein